MLQAQITRIAAQQADHDSAPVTTVEAVRKAARIWRAAVNRHNQLVANVLKLRDSLRAAEAKEDEAALAVAKAKSVKKKAATVLAQAEGITSQAATTAGDKEE